MSHLHSQTRPADILVPLWSIGKSAVCDVTAVNQLNPSLILGVSTTVGYLAAEKEVVKMTTYVGWLGREGPGNVQLYQQEVGSGLSLQ